MHIIWVNQHASLVGGAEHYIANTARHLQARSIRSTLLYDPNQPTSPEMLDSFDQAYPFIGEANQLSAKNADLVFVHQTRDSGIIAHLAEADIPIVEFFHDHWLFCLRVRKYTSIRKQTCKKVASRQACYPCLGFAQRQSKFPHLRLRSISDLYREHQLRSRFAGFVTGSTYMANQAIAQGFDPKKVHATPLYAELPKTPQVREPRENGKLLYVGALLPSKGLDILINSLKHTTAPTKLDIIGDGASMPEMRRMVEQFGLCDRVRFWGRLSQEEIGAHYRRAMCLIVPSRTPEGFGIVGAEAMSHGLPAIVSDIGGALEWLEPGLTGLTFPTNDARALARAIDLLASSPALVRDMGKAARNRYNEYFRPEHHIDRLLGVFNSVLQNRGMS